MNEKLTCEETIPGYFVVCQRPSPQAHRIKIVATIESRCGRWLWQMRDESDIGLCDSFDGAKAAIASIVCDVREGGFRPPTALQVRRVAEAYCQSNHIDPAFFDADEFLDYFEACDWTTKRGNPMRDWRPAVRSWIKGRAKS